MFFFFSSRRRHTRCGRDWSSDVCSSDLCSSKAGLNQLTAVAAEESRLKKLGIKYYALSPGIVDTEMQQDIRTSAKDRSEERRVGKECRSRWWPDQEKKKYVGQAGGRDL